MADNKKVYQNDTLAWMAGNFANQSKSDWQNIAQNERPVVKERLWNAAKSWLDLSKKVLVDTPIQWAKTVWNFLFGSPEKVQTDEERLYEYVGKGYTTKNGDDYLYSPEWERSNVRYDGSIWQPEVSTPQTTALWRRLSGRPDVFEEQTTPTTTPTVTWNPIWEWEASGTPSTGMVGGRPWWFNGWNVATTTNQRQLKNADVNFSQYWDDSSAPNQATAWGQNDKYTWEFTRNSNIWYDPNITTADLDPNYLFWMDAQWANTDSAGYIARRNDMIASALYNEWRTSKQDVIDFLSSQPGWMNSTEADRANTIESIWKRLGGMVNENEIKDAAVADLNKFTWVSSDPTVNAMEADLNKDNTSVIYWKVWTDEDGSVKTLEDENSVYRVMNESRIQQYKQINSMDSQAIAAAIIGNAISEDGQQMRDLQQYNPDKYEYVMQAIKQIRWQQNINSIANWTTDFSTNIWNNSKSEIESFANNNANSSTSAADILSSVNSTLASNEAAKTAQETMDTIEKDMAKLKNRLKNLRSEANSLFKWDVPQYIVNAYMSNRTAEIQNEMSMLEDRYNAAYSRYQSEWERVKWEKEFDLKKEELDIKKSNAAWDKYMDEQWLELKWTELDSKSWITRYYWSGMAWAWLKNNNPGNIKDTQFWNVIWVWANGFAQFATPEDWFDALVEKVKFNQTNPSSRYYGKTIAEYFQIYAPSSDGNDPKGYAQDIANKLWVSVNTPISQVDATKLAAAIAKHDSGYDYSTYGQFRNSTQDTALNNLEWHGNVYDTSLYPGWNGLTDDEKITVWNLLTYQTDPATLPKTWTNGESNKKIRAAAGAIGRQFGYDERKFKQVDAVQKAWDKSFWPNWVGSANTTAASLLKTLSNSFKEFNATDLQTVNSWINQFKLETWDPTVWAMYSDLRVAASEYAKALKGSASATTEEIREIHNLLSGKMSNKQAQEVFKHFAQNLVEKNATEAQNYARVVGYKPDSPYLEDVSEWFNDELWINLWDYYNYKWWWWSLVWQSNSNLSNDEMIYNIFSY